MNWFTILIKIFEIPHLLNFQELSKNPYKMEIVNCVSAIQNYPSFSEVIVEELKRANGTVSQKTSE